jgi:hypothetical protein
MTMPWNARRERRRNREERSEIARSSDLSSDEGSVQRLREVAETQLALQADNASSLDTQALTLLTVDVAFFGILTSVLVSPVSLPPYWAWALVPLGLSLGLAFVAAAVRGAPATGADLVEVLRHKRSAGEIPAAGLSVLLARRAIEARELNLVQLGRKQRATSRGVLALFSSCLVLGALALADQGVQSKHGSNSHHIDKRRRSHCGERRRFCRGEQGPLRGRHSGDCSKRPHACSQASP